VERFGGIEMYALNKKYWSHRGSGFPAHPAVERFLHFLQSPRFWAIMGSMLIVALVIAAVAAMAMLALWMSEIDLSTFDPTPMIN
jgi:hypothetical protein